ncbi:MAG: adenosine kinase [Spirulinaceae cyanobacterium SM2_1_0]|nr:adenosine kinase [Spirulinaceae cyanobacterium SM2_1_0]
MGKTYDVYGIGNALVDLEFEVSVADLQTLKVEKGVMTLVDELRHGELLTDLRVPPAKQASGGSAANSVVAVSQLGGKGFYSCKVAADEFGAFYLSDLLECGVDNNLQHQSREYGITGKCIVFVTPDADRTMNTFLGIAANFSTAELVPERLQDSQYLYIEGYLVSSPTGKEAAIAARKLAEAAGTKVALSLSDPNMVRFFRDGLVEMIGAGVDFLFANETEACELAGGSDLAGAIADLKTRSHAFAITRGPAGSIIFDGEQVLEIAPVPVKAVDTVGAGDMYAGALLYGLSQGWSYPQAGRLASRAAAQVVSQFGPRLPNEAVRALQAA